MCRYFLYCFLRRGDQTHSGGESIIALASTLTGYQRRLPAGYNEPLPEILTCYRVPCQCCPCYAPPSPTSPHYPRSSFVAHHYSFPDFCTFTVSISLLRYSSLHNTVNHALSFPNFLTDLLTISSSSSDPSHPSPQTPHLHTLLAALTLEITTSNLYQRLEL